MSEPQAQPASPPPHKAEYTIVYDDPLFKQVFVDVEEWREQPVPHLYVHGGFEGTDARFSIYFPPEAKYEGRFFQYILPVPGNENALSKPESRDSSHSIGFAVDNGGYLVESNLGAAGFVPTADPEISLWRASAAVAEHSRLLARRFLPGYGPHRPYGYAWGGSGGAFKVIACIENTHGVWDGVVPFIHGSPVALPNNFTAQAHAMRLLRDKADTIVDAVDPGGSGDIYAGLDEEQRAALLEVMRLGLPPETWFNHEAIAFGYTGVLASLVPAVQALDGAYFEDFWNKPGYLGHDQPDALARYRVHHETTITRTFLPAALRAMRVPVSLAAAQPANAGIPAAALVTDLPDADLQGATLTIKSGAATGMSVMITGVFDGVVAFGYGQSAAKLGSVQPGDAVEIDNSVYLALQTYHHHQVAPPEYHVYDQYRGADGAPLYPQRMFQAGSLFNQSGKMSGVFTGKMIVVENLMDEIAFPWHADWYRSKVRAALADRFEDNYRLWYVERALHTPPVITSRGPHPAITTRAINFVPVLQQALRDVAAWAENGIAPPASTAYRVVDGQVQVPATAAERRGIQPVVVARANGGERAHVAVGERVTFSAVIDVPPGAGLIISVEWDFEGNGDFPVKQPLRATSKHVEVEIGYAFSQAGTYFPAVRASANREGNANTPHARIQNLGRVRVVVR